MGGLSIVITLNEKSEKLKNLLSNIFQYELPAFTELVVSDCKNLETNRKLLRKYAPKCLIRHFFKHDLKLLKKKCRYSEIIHVSTLDDLRALDNKIPLTSPTPQVQNSVMMNNEELIEENEQLLFHFLQLQEELEQYYLKYQNLKQKIETA